jgi:DNA-binding NarL/FixJ family response regulator
MLPRRFYCTVVSAKETTNTMRRKGSSRETPGKRRILIVDDHPLVRRGLTALIEYEPDLTVCAQAATEREGLDAISSSRPDLVIADLWLKDGDGLEMVKEIRLGYRDLPILVLSMHDSPVYAERAFQAGASGYVTKQEMSETVLIAIRRVLSGEKYVSPKIR